jgi:Flp pilus assembly protein TadG
MKNHMKYTGKGQSLVEFALIIPAFLLMAVMVFDLGRAVYYSSAIHNAAREAARYGIVHPADETGMKLKAINYAVGLGLQETDVTIDVVVPENSASFPPPRVTVYVNYDFVPATPLVSNFISGGQVTLTGEATMKLEALP